MSGLPRELLKWLQSLDLTYSVKNVKRDFSNGFLIAEIFSRYYVADVEMHSYDNGQSLQRKLDNWAQLNKFFKKKGIDVDKALIDDVVHSKNLESPTKLVASIYTQLTGREVKLLRPSDAASDPNDPAYTRPNATSLLSSNIRDSELATTLSDHNTASARAKALIDGHADELRMDRESQPSRYGVGGLTASATQSAVMSSMLRAAAPKPVQQEIASTQVRFQEVRVQAVDRNIAQLRASRDQALKSTSYTTGASVDGGVAPVGSMGGYGAEMAVPPPPAGGEGRVSIADMLTRLSLGACPEALVYLSALSDQPDFRVALENMDNLPKQTMLSLIGAAQSEAAEGIAAACRASPANAYELFALVQPAMLYAEDTEVFQAIASFLRAVGEGLSSLTAAAYTVLTEYALPWLLPCLRAFKDPTKRSAVLSVVYAIVPPTPEAHIDAIRALQNAVNDQATFLSLLPALIAMESAFSADLVALYVYFCVLAVDLESRHLRAAAVGMLVTVAEHNSEPILALLPKLHTLADDGWWEVRISPTSPLHALPLPFLCPPLTISANLAPLPTKVHAQLGRLCAKLLGVDSQEDDHVTLAIVTLLSKLLNNRQPAAQMVILASTAPVLARTPELAAPFIDSLLALGPDERAACLNVDSMVTLEKAGRDTMTFANLPSQWPSLLVAQTLMLTAREHQLDTLEVPYVDVITALLPYALADDKAEWSQWLRDNKDYLYVALCDEELCRPVTASLLPLFTILQDECLPTFATLLSSLRMVCDNAPALCTTVATDFLLKLHELGEPFEGALRNLTVNFDEPMKAAFSTLVERVGA